MKDKFLFGFWQTINSQFFVTILALSWLSIPFWHSLEAWLYFAPVIAVLGLLSKTISEHLITKGSIVMIDQVKQILAPLQRYSIVKDIGQGRTKHADTSA